jgi:hypothetical protein
MNSYEKYYNDPDLTNEPAPLREVHAIRLMIQDETKNMTPQQRIDYYRKSGEEASKKYGFKRVESIGY